MGRSYQASFTAASGEDGELSGRAFRFWHERAVCGGFLADVEGLAAGVDGLEVDRGGGTSGYEFELDGLVVAGSNCAAES